MLTFSVEITGTSDTYQYSIDNVNWQSSTTFSVASTGTYNIWFRGLDLVSKVLGTVDIVDAFDPLRFSSVTFTNCTATNVSDGTITIVATGGTAPYQYSIDGSSWYSSGAFTGLPNGDYNISVKDATDYIIGGVTISISELSTPIGIESLTFTHCSRADVKDGTITIIANGGVSPYTYSIGQAFYTNGAFVGLTKGIYPISIKDSNGDLLDGITVDISSPSYNTIYVNDPNTSCNLNKKKHIHNPVNIPTKMHIKKRTC